MSRYFSASGVVLGRSFAGEGDILMTLFLKGVGLTFASARGASSGKVRFGGGTEPLVWGTFSFYEGSAGRKSLTGVDVADDMLKMRARPDSLMAAVRWAKLVVRHLPPGHQADDLLANLYWNMRLLDEGFPPLAAEWRFLWRWLRLWGLAPDASEFADTPLERGVLQAAALSKVDGLMASGPDFSPMIGHAELFRQASRRAEFLLRET
ncbi:MAG: recombination protein O N-terminal domain-containing protein [Synergistaceae bacterium]|nr:recombination protein O N-terminal domain-containing protein [Synergistaceae bacterium]